METRMHPLVQMRDVWTIEDVRALEVADWWRYEVVDGALVVSPAAAADHEVAGEELRAAIRAALDPELIVIGPMGLDLGTSYFVPDLLVTSRAGLRGRVMLAPADVLLVVEIVSPGSVTMDRVLKPAKYAAAGIRAYWRVETDPVALTAYVLPHGADVYTEVGTWGAGESAVVTVPFPVSIEIDRLVALG